MANLQQLLKAMVEKGASDLHITTGSPPLLRIDGELVPLQDARRSSPVDTKQLCYSILTDEQKRKFEEDNELDLSFGVKGLSPLPRQHLHAARRGRPARSGPSRSRSSRFDELGLPPVVAELSQEAARARAGDRARPARASRRRSRR